MELFAGWASLTAAIKEVLGDEAAARPWDSASRQDADLRVAAAVAEVTRLIDKVVEWLHAAPPCRTFTRARRPEACLRTEARPEGNEADPAVKEANELARLCAAWAERCVKLGKYFSIENPLNSFLWLLKEFINLAKLPGVKFVTLDQCAYAGPHKKPTGVLTNAPWIWASARRCAEAKPHKHVTLEGKVWSYKDNALVWYTSEAAEYPWGLCMAWAQGWKAWRETAGNQVAEIQSTLRPAHVDPSAKEIRDKENDECIGGLRRPEKAVAVIPGWQSAGVALRCAIHGALDSSPKVESLLNSLHADSSREGQLRSRAQLQLAAEAAGQRAAVALGTRLGVSPAASDTGYRAELAQAITELAGDPDSDVPTWMGGNTPLGISAPIAVSGVFPLARPAEAAAASLQFYEQNMERGWEHSNYASFEEHAEQASAEVRRLAAAGHLRALGRSWKQILLEMPDAICTRLACLVKRKADGTIKVRLVVDMRRSGVNGLAEAPERVVLPRVIDVVNGGLELMASGDPVEFFSGDFADAFLSLRVLEQERCYLVVSDGDQYFAYSSVPFGLGTAPLLWGRVGAWLGRATAATLEANPAASGKSSALINIYVDDPIVAASGTDKDRTRAFATALVLWTMVGARVSWQKLKRGHQLEWCGVEFRAASASIFVTITAERMEEIVTTARRMRKTKGLVFGVRSLAGLLSWIGSFVPRLKPFIRPLWAAVTEAAAGGPGRRGGRVPSGAAFVSQIHQALDWVIAWCEQVATPRLMREFRLAPPAGAPRLAVRTDASTTGMGAVLLDERTGAPIEFWADQLTAEDEALFGMARGDPAGMTVWELLAIVVSVRTWKNRLRGCQADIIVQADSLAALGAAMRMSSPVAVVNSLAAELALALEAAGADIILGSHIRGILNVQADALSRLGEGHEIPAALRGIPRRSVGNRSTAWRRAPSI